jgi:hypothetical protein
MASELDFCRHLLTKFEAFWTHDKALYLGPFRQPVNEVRDNAPGYYTTVRSPMDFSLMDVKLTNGLASLDTRSNNDTSTNGQSN